MFFRDIIGHNTVIQSLLRAYAQGTLHHAYLFSGPDGVGKRRVATALARLHCCISPRQWGEFSDACGTCSGCVKSRAGSHPDLLNTAPDGRFTKIEQVREIIAATRFQPAEAARRIVIMDQADTLKEEAANAMLKTLEEPRGDTMFILVTSAPQRLLPTIRSRCLPIRFGVLTDSQVSEILASSNADEHLRAVAARFGMGSVSRALKALESATFAGRSDLISRLLSLKPENPGDSLRLADELSKDTDALPEVLDLLRFFARDAAFLRSGTELGRILNSDAMHEIRQFSSRRTVEQILEFSRTIDSTERLLQGNVNARMALETMFLQVAGSTSPKG